MVKMVKNIQLISGCLVVMICVVFLAQATAWSALRVSPTQQNLNIPPGGTETIQLLLSNSSRTDSMQVKLYVTDYNIRQDGSPVFPNANTTRDSLSSWIKIEDTDIVLMPGERRSVACKYTVPSRAEGERFGAIMVEKVPDNDKTPYQELPADRLGGVIKLTYRIACTVMLLVDGTKVDGTNFLKNGVIKNVAVNIPESDSWMEKQEIEVSAVFGNEGNIHITPRGGEALIVHKKLRKVVARIPLTTPRNPTIFPGGMRDFKGYIKEPLRPGEYTVQAKFNMDSEGGPISPANTEFVITPELARMMNQVFYGEGEYSGPPIIGAEPQLVEVEVPGGGYRSSVITINNQHDEPVQVAGYIKGLQYQPDGEMRIVEPGTVERSCADWITVQPAKFKLSPGESKKIMLKLRIPDGADGGHYGKLVFETSPLSANASQLEPEKSLGSTLMVIVPGTSRIKGSITDFGTAPVEDGKPTEFTIGFNNTGNMHVRPTGTIKVKDYMGDIVHEQSLGKNVPFVLPGNTRRLKEVYGGEKLPAGKYTATVVVNYGGEADARADYEFTIPDKPLTDEPAQVATKQKKTNNS